MLLGLITELFIQWKVGMCFYVMKCICPLFWQHLYGVHDMLQTKQYVGMVSMAQ